MTKTQQKVYDMLCRVQQFVTDHAAALGQITQSSARRQLDALVLAMSNSAEVAVTSRMMAKGESANTHALRRELRMNHMRQIAAIARAELREVPQFEALRWPSDNESTPRLVLRARAMAAVAREHAEVFLEHQLPVNFAEQLLAAADALDASVQERSADLRDAAGAYGLLAASRSRAPHVVRVLNAQVEKALAGDAALLDQWRFAKRVGLRGGRRHEVTTPVQSATQQDAASGAAASSGTTVTPLTGVAQPQHDVLAA